MEYFDPPDKTTMLRRSPLPQRKTPLPRSKKPIARGKRPNVKRPGPARRVSVNRDQDYMDWLKRELCIVCKYRYPGDGPDMTYQVTDSDPAHTAKTNGVRSKGPDSSCIPLCRHHHDEMDGRAGTKVVTKKQFAAKYSLDLAAIAAEHYARFKKETSC